MNELELFESREIELRGWNEENKIMFPILTINNKEIKFCGENVEKEKLKKITNLLFLDVIFMQYTLFNDHYNNKIFEGDILLRINTYNARYQKKVLPRESRCVVTSHKENFGIWDMAVDYDDRKKEFIHLCELKDYPEDNIKVIGNIFENKNLLSKEDIENIHLDEILYNYGV